MAFAGKLAPAGSVATAQSRPGFSTKSCELPELEDELLEELELDELDELEVDELELEDELLLELPEEELLEEELELDELAPEEEGSPPQATNVEKRTNGIAQLPKLVILLFMLVTKCIELILLFGAQALVFALFHMHFGLLIRDNSLNKFSVNSPRLDHIFTRSMINNI